MLPPDLFAPMTTVQHYFYRWRDSGLWRSINHTLLLELRQAEGREASPSASVIDSQSVKTTESGGPRGYNAGKKLKGVLSKIGKWHIEIIMRSDRANGFEVLPRRWVVERTFAWLNRNRRLAKDFKRTIESASAWLYLASIQLMTRRTASLCNQAR